MVAIDYRVIGYYALAVGNVATIEAPGRIKRNMPEPIPVMVLARLAIDQGWHGSDLLRDALLRTRQAAGIAGIRALPVHAIDARAAEFYVKHGFMPSPLKPLMFMLPLSHFT